MQQVEMAHVGRYTRDLGASLARMFENALDWEHLPHLHAQSFASFALDAADNSGWCGEALLPGRPDQPLSIDLRLDRAAGIWLTRTSAKGQLQSEIRTRAEATGDRSCRVTVDFWVVGVAAAQRAAVGAGYRALYARLYDEDEAMMIARQQALDSPDRSWRALGGHRIPAACPHLGLPLDGAEIADGVLTCPWHGYRFDLTTGRCISGAACGWRRS